MKKENLKLVFEFLGELLEDNQQKSVGVNSGRPVVLEELSPEEKIVKAKKQIKESNSELTLASLTSRFPDINIDVIMEIIDMVETGRKQTKLTAPKTKSLIEHETQARINEELLRPTLQKLKDNGLLNATTEANKLPHVSILTPNPKDIKNFFPKFKSFQFIIYVFY